MDIRIDKKSEVPVRQQLAEQIIFSIATERLKPGDALPSVRELARRLKVHRNTVSQAYRDLKRRAWLAGQRGSHVIVRLRGRRSLRENGWDLDDLINATIRLAREQGFTLKALREHVEKRLLAQPPDHVLVVEQERGLRSLLQAEIQLALNRPVEGCALEDLSNDPGLALGALTVAAHYAIGDVDPLVPKNNPAMPLAFTAADEQLELIRKLPEPATIAIVSVSEVFTKTALSLFASVIGRRHTLCGFRFPLENPVPLKAIDLVFADSIACLQVKHPKVIPYRLIQSRSLEYIVSAMRL